MGAGHPMAGGLLVAISAVVMAFSAIGAGYSYTVWTDTPTATGRVGAAVLSALEPVIPGVFAFCVGLFLLAMLTTLYSIRRLRVV